MLDKFYSPGELKKQMEELTHRFIICYSDGQPVAFASWSEVAPHIFKLHKIYILPGCQGNGIGKCMIKHIVEDTRTMNAKELRLNVNRYNYSAMTFYEKTGFKLLFEEDIDIGNGYFMNDYVLSLII